MTEQTFFVGDWRVEPALNRLSRADTEHAVEPKVMQLLVFLAGRQGRPATTEDIYLNLWPDTVVTDTSIYWYVNQLRKALGDSKKEPRYLETIPKKGYRLIAPVGEAETRPGKGAGGLAGIIAELKRRRVFKAALVYAGAGWVVMEFVDVMFPALRLPEWTITLVAALFITGFPLALLLAWAFDLTPAGLKRTSDSLWVSPAARSRFGGPMVLIVVLAVSGTVAWKVWQGASLEPTLAVLPFVNMSDSPEDEYFSDGITEELLNSLAQMGGVRVTGRTSSFYFKGRDGDLRDIGAALGVQHLLEGSVRRTGDTVRITAQLIDSEDGMHRWSETFDRRLDDIFAIQQEIAQKVAEALRLELVPQETSRQERDYDAYDLVLKADALAQESGGGRQGLLAVQELYREATEIDPALTDAWLGLALTCVLDISVFNTAFDENMECVDDALEIVAELGLQEDARYYLIDAVTDRFEWQGYGDTPERRERIETLYEHALELNPSLTTTYLSYAKYFRKIGDLDRMAALLERGLDIDPLDGALNLEYARVQSARGEHDLAFHRVSQVPEWYPDYNWGYFSTAEVLASQGRFDEALDWLLRAAIDEDDMAGLFRVATTYLSMGDTEAAIDRYRRWTTNPVIGAYIKGIQGDHESGLAEAEALLRNTPDAMRGSAELVGDLAYLSGDYEGARYYYESASPELVRHPEVSKQNFDIAVKLGATLRQLGSNERANELLGLARSWMAGHNRLGFEGYYLSMAEAHAVSGERDAAIAELESLFDEGWEQLAGDWTDPWVVPVSPLFDSLRGDPEFEELVARADENLTAQRSRLAQLLTERAEAAGTPASGMR